MVPPYITLRNVYEYRKATGPCPVNLAVSFNESWYSDRLLRGRFSCRVIALSIGLPFNETRGCSGINPRRVNRPHSPRNTSAHFTACQIIPRYSTRDKVNPPIWAINSVARNNESDSWCVSTEATEYVECLISRFLGEIRSIGFVRVEGLLVLNR